ncbi:MAG: hypothetical protein GQ558_05005, partial [Thermoplasmata archaeon]|nr:hypothetical protein [Thermoplasmata archaeon]
PIPPGVYDIWIEVLDDRHITALYIEEDITFSDLSDDEGNDGNLVLLMSLIIGMLLLVTVVVMSFKARERAMASRTEEDHDNDHEITNEQDPMEEEQ